MGVKIPNKELFRIGEVAALLNVHENTVRNMIDDGRLQAQRFPARHRCRLRIPRLVLVEYLSK